MNFFVGKSDNSFYFHLYEEANGNLKTYEVSSLENGKTKIDLENITDHEFKRNKISLHESGYIHSTNNQGKRLKDNIIGIPFNQIEISNLILLVIPKRIDSLEVIDKSDESRDVVVHLPNSTEPFSINFEIFKKNNEDKLVINHPKNILGGYLNITIDQKDYGVRLYLQSIKGKVRWPDVSFVLTRIG